MKLLKDVIIKLNEMPGELYKLFILRCFSMFALSSLALVAGFYIENGLFITIGLFTFIGCCLAIIYTYHLIVQHKLYIAYGKCIKKDVVSIGKIPIYYTCTLLSPDNKRYIIKMKKNELKKVEESVFYYAYVTYSNISDSSKINEYMINNPFFFFSDIA